MEFFNMDAAFAYLHLMAILVIVVTLWTEFILYRPTLDLKTAKTLMHIDGFYGLGSALLIGSGFSRALWFATKGWEFYKANPLFWGKVSMFVVWSLLSLPGTFHFLSYRKSVKQGLAPEISPATYQRIRRLMIAQLCFVPIVPWLGVFLARGYGMG